MDGLYNKHLSLPVLEVRKSKVKVLTGLVSGKSLIPGFIDSCLLTVSSHGRGRGGRSTLINHLPKVLWDLKFFLGGGINIQSVAEICTHVCKCMLIINVR